jgi:LacI family transcriptional regulator
MSSPSSRKPPAPERPVGIKDIAKALGISTGTVDRALHAKPGVNALTRERVLNTAVSLGYRPNLAARHLQSRRSLRVSVHLPQELALFWDSLRDGIREAAAPFEPSLRVDFRTYPRLGEGDVELLEEAIEQGTHGLIIAPGDPVTLAPSMKKVAEKKIPVICVVTDAPDTQRLSSVSADPYTVGAVAAEFLSRVLPQGGPVAFFTGWLGTQDHAEKLRGFEASLLACGSRIELVDVVEAHDDEREGHRRALKLLRGHPGLKGIYVSTVNSLPVVRAVEREGRLRDVTLVTTDLFAELVACIRAGKVIATVYQRPLTQGRLALQAMAHYLLERAVPQTRIKVVPHLVMRSNLDLFLERLQLDREGLRQPGDLIVEGAVPHVRPR